MPCRTRTTSSGETSRRSSNNVSGSGVKAMRGAKSGRLAGYALLAPAFLVMGVMLVAPLMALFALSLWTQTGFEIDRTPTLANYWTIIEPADTPYVWMGIPFPFKYPPPAVLLFKSVVVSLAATLLVILLAYPMAYFLAFRVKRNKALWLVLLTIPFWTSYLLRIFSWKIVLGFNGAINSGLKSLGIIDQPLEFLLYNPAAVTITLAHAWIAFTVLPIYVSLEKIDRSLLEAATDLGDSKWQRFFRITLPLVGTGHHRRGLAGVHSHGGRLCHADAGGGAGRNHDRKPDTGAFPAAEQCAARCRRLDHDDADHRDPGCRLSLGHRLPQAQVEGGLNAHVIPPAQLLRRSVHGVSLCAGAPGAALLVQ